MRGECVQHTLAVRQPLRPAAADRRRCGVRGVFTRPAPPAAHLSRRSLRLHAWREMSGLEESLEMLEPDARAGPAVDPDAFLALKRHFDVEGHVVLDESVPGLLRVMLRHASGSRADVCLRGATVTSWRIVNGSEVVYIRPDTALEEGQPISGGIPIAFPQAMNGSQPGARSPALPAFGFADAQDWELVETGLTTPKSDPFVRLRLRDSPSIRAVWDHAFELEYTVTLGIKQLGLRLTAQNTGTKDLEFCTALRAHLGVSDLANDPIMVLGLQNVRYDDKSETRQGGSDLPRWPSPSMKFTGPNDIAFLESQKRVALEVGTGCTVFVENTAGFEDHKVWNMWEDNVYYRNFVCISSARVGKPVKLAPKQTWEGVASLFARDVLLSSSLPQEAEEEAAGSGVFQSGSVLR